MTYELTINEETFEIDDNDFFDSQPKGFRKAFDELRQGDTAEFDNASVTVIGTGRVVVAVKSEE
jgi:hypothetical protein